MLSISEAYPTAEVVTIIKSISKISCNISRKLPKKFPTTLNNLIYE
jgi:hypothetical protein